MVRPKKHLGQHFLTDPGIAERTAGSIENTSRILEIGPGKGILTKPLLELKNSELKVVELDSESVEYLRENFPSLEVIQTDFLKMNVDNVFSGNRFTVVGNFPYNISSQIVFKILENRNIIHEMVGMFQREVAQRICSPPGNKEYGILSVVAQRYYDLSYLFTIKEGVFFPKPKVKSGVIRMERKPDPNDGISYPEFLKFIKTAFEQRRKQLKNTLKKYLPESYKHPLLTSRPEALSHREFSQLFLDIRKAAT